MPYKNPEPKVGQVWKIAYIDHEEKPYFEAIGIIKSYESDYYKITVGMILSNNVHHPINDFWLAYKDDFEEESIEYLGTLDENLEYFL